jgi:hypothetical protein
MPDAGRGFVEGVIERQAGIAGNAKNDLNSVCQKHLYDSLSSIHRDS